MSNSLVRSMFRLVLMSVLLCMAMAAHHANNNNNKPAYKRSVKNTLQSHGDVTKQEAELKRRERRRRRRKRGPARRLPSATMEVNGDELDQIVPNAYRLSTVEQLEQVPQHHRHHQHQHPHGHGAPVTFEQRDEYRRRLADEDWMTWEEAETAGRVGPLRTEFVTFFDGSEELLVAAEHCNTIGQSVNQGLMGSSNIVGNGIKTCEEADVVGAESTAGQNTTAEIIHSRLEWVFEYFRDTFQVKQSLTGVTLDSGAVDNYPFAGNPDGPTDGSGDLLCDTTIPDCPNATYPDADLVIVVTLHPLGADRSGIAGYASCVQSDQFDRCTVGYFNWVPSVLDLPEFLSTETIMVERATALHESMHVLGGIKNSKLFRYADTGEPVPTAEKVLVQTQSSFIGKQVTMWATPGVVAMAQEEFNCSEIVGLPLEDLPSGANGHWESRLMGSEVMSYGLTTGEYYVSRLTLQFFEDTNQYLVDYEAGTQRFYNATGSDAALAKDVFAAIFATSAEDGTISPTRTWPKGYQRWGRNAGCDFFNKYPSLDTWTDRYFCTEDNANACTGDNLMSGKCSLYSYGSGDDQTRASSDWYSRSSISTCSDGLCSITTSVQSNTAAPGLPPSYRYLADLGDDTMGGFLGAMDYAPVVTGYINCQDDSPTAGTLKFSIDEVEYASDADWLSFGDGQASLGGQIKSENSRCFISSLLALTESYVAVSDTSVFSLAGACYLSNCYREDYLQIGIKTATQTGTKWFRCSEVSSKFIAGYIGSFKCPDPVEFCQYEDITGVWYTENNETLEWVFWGLLLGTILICFIIFCFCKKARSFVAGRLKVIMNFHIPKHKVFVARRQQKTAAAVFLTVISILWIIIGIAVFGVGIISLLDNGDPEYLLWEGAAALVFHFCGLGLFIIVLAVLGIMAGNADRPTLKATFYLYINMFMMIIFIFLSAIVLGVSEWLAVIVDVIWDELYIYFPDDWLALSSSEVWDRIYTWYLDAPYIIWTIVAWNAFSMVGGMICAFVMLTFRNVLGTMLFWMNLLVTIAGVSFIVSCSLLVPVVPTSWLAGLFISGIFMLAVGAVGLFTCRRKQVVRIYLGMAGVAFVTVLVVGSFLFASVEVNSQRVANLSAEELGEVINNLAFIAQDWDETTFQTFLDSNLTAAAVAMLILAFLMLATMGAALLVLKDIHDTEKEEDYEGSSHRSKKKRNQSATERKREWMAEQDAAPETADYNAALKQKNSQRNLTDSNQGIELQEVKTNEEDETS